MKRIGIITLFALLSINSIAQDINGKIKGRIEDQQQKPVEGATISLLRTKDSSVVKLSVADKSGVFEIDKINEGSYLLSVSAMGFEMHYTKPVSLSVEKTELVLSTISLTTEAKNMAAVTVTARKPLIELKADRTIVNVESSVTNVGATALEVLEKSPGVLVDRDGNISLKGKQGVLIMIDGKPSYLSGSDLSSFLSSMNANQLEQIEIMSNPPAKYDAAGNSGVINIKTKKNKQRGFNGNVSLSYGQGAYYKTNNSLNLNYRNDKFNLFTNYSINANRGFGELDIMRTYFEPDGKTVSAYFWQPTQMMQNGKSQNLKIGMDYNLSKKTTLGIVGSGFISPRSFNSVSTGYLQNASAETDSIATTTGRNSDKWKNGSVNVNLRQQFSGNEELTADLDYIQYRSVSDQFFDNHIYYPDNTTISRDYLKGYLPSDIKIYSAKADYSKSFSKGLKVEGGLKSSLVKTDNQAIYSEKNGNGWETDYNKTNHFLYEENINAAYVNANKQVKKWNIQAGLRFENTNYKGHQLGNPQKQDSSFSRKYNSLFPTLYISYQADSNNTFTINTGRRIDRPQYRQLNPFLFFINKFTYAVGNPFLLPQFTYNAEISHSYKGILNTGLNYSYTKGFFTQVFRPEGEVTILTEGNIGKAENYGMSVGTNLKPAKWWNFNLNVNVNYRKIDAEAFGRPIKTEAFNGQLNMNNQFNFSKGWSAELSGFYNSRSKEGQFDIRPFGQLSAGISKQILKNKGSIRLNVRDIFFTQVIDGQIKYGNVQEHFVQSRDSRVVNISFSYRFGKNFKSGPQRNRGGAADEQRRVGSGG